LTLSTLSAVKILNLLKSNITAVRHFENRKIVITPQRFDRSPRNLARWRPLPLRTLSTEDFEFYTAHRSNYRGSNVSKLWAKDGMCKNGIFNTEPAISLKRSGLEPNGRRPPYWKILNLVRWRIGLLTILTLSTLSAVKINFEPFKIKYYGRPPFWKSKNRNNSATIWPMATKFSTMTPTAPANTIDRGFRILHRAHRSNYRGSNVSKLSAKDEDGMCKSGIFNTKPAISLKRSGLEPKLLQSVYKNSCTIDWGPLNCVFKVMFSVL